MTVISAAVEENGWVLAVRGDWGPTAGAWEYGGFDRTNGRFLAGDTDQFPLDPDGAAKLVLHLTSAGHERRGVEAVAATARPRRLVGTKALRRPWPNQSQLDEIEHGDGTRTVRIALSQRVFAGDVLLSVGFAAGWKAGETAALLEAVGNGSGRAIPLPVSRWATVPYQLVAGTPVASATGFRVDVVVASHFPEHAGAELNLAVAAVKVEASDGLSTRTSWLSVGNSTAHGDDLRCWTGEVDLVGLNPGIVTLHKTLYPFIGAPRSTGSGHSASALASLARDWAVPLQLCFDPTGSRHAANRRYVFVDRQSPNALLSSIGSVVLHESVDAARAAPLASKPQNLTVAIQKMRDQGATVGEANGIAGGARTIEYWEILVTDGQTVEFGTESVTTTNFVGAREGFLVIRGDPAAADPRATCAVQSNGSARGITVPRLRFRDLRLQLGHSTLLSNATNAIIWLDGCDVTAKPGYATDTSGVRITSVASWSTNLRCWGYNGQPFGSNLLRNVSRTIGSRSLAHVGVTIGYEAGVSGTSYLFDVSGPDSIVWNVKASRWDGTIIRADGQTSEAGALGVFGAPWQLVRTALVNVLVEGAHNRLVQLGEESYTQMNDCIWDGVCIVGDGVNFHNEPPWPMQWAAGAVSVGVVAHGLTVGDTVTISGCTPSGYDGSYAVASVPDANRFTYAKSSNPGTMSVRGSVTLPGGVVRALDFWNLRHTGNTLLNVVFDRNATKNDVWRPDSKVIGNWETLYGVGMRGKVHANRIAGSPQDWQYAYDGLGARTNLDYAAAEGSNWLRFVNDGTGHDGRTAAWNGDYRPVAGSPLVGAGQVSNIDRTLDGAVRGASFAAGALGLSFAVPDALAAVSTQHRVTGGEGRLVWMARLSPAAARHESAATAAGVRATPPGGGEAVPGVRTLVVEDEGRTVWAGRD